EDEARRREERADPPPQRREIPVAVSERLRHLVRRQGRNQASDAERHITQLVADRFGPNKADMTQEPLNEIFDRMVVQGGYWHAGAPQFGDERRVGELGCITLQE